jgi:hypothetical protein
LGGILEDGLGMGRGTEMRVGKSKKEDYKIDRRDDRAKDQGERHLEDLGTDANGSRERLGMKEED